MFDNCDWSSSTMAIGARVKVSGTALELEYTENVNENTINTNMTGSRHKLHNSFTPKR